MLDAPKTPENDCLRYREYLETFAPEIQARIVNLSSNANFSRNTNFTGAEDGLRQHAESCEECRRATADFFAVRTLLGNFTSRGETARSWFSAGVMAAISAREEKLALSSTSWAAVPKFASRLAWALAAIILAASTWLYEKPVNAPSNQPAAEAAPDTLFETAAMPVTHDEVLASLAERKP